MPKRRRQPKRRSKKKPKLNTYNAALERTRLKGRPATIERWPGERILRHRAMLLWGMQEPGYRCISAVARALAMADGSIRSLRGTGCWHARVAEKGEGSDQACLDLYRKLYMVDYGEIELPHIASYMVCRLGAVNGVATHVDADLEEARAVAEDVAQRDAEMGPQPGVDVPQKHSTKKRLTPQSAELAAEQAAAQAARDYRATVRKDAEQHIRLVDASLGLIARRLKAQEIKVGVRDIPVLLECRGKLVRVVSGTQGSAPGAVVDSARVRHAKETGGDVLAAMHEDAQELVAILGALKVAEGTDLAALAEADQQVRDSAKSAEGA